MAFSNEQLTRSSITRSPDRPITRFERVFVWLGGAMFVAALAFCAYSYLVSWSSANGGSPSAFGVDVALFGLFAAHHSLFARNGVNARLARSIPERLLRSVYVWTASVLLVVVCALWQAPGGDVYRVAGWRAAAHAAVQIAGLWLIASSVRTIDALELAGIRRHSAGAVLQITGPYRWVRHPLYLGWVLAVFGAAHMTAARLAFAAISSLYLLIAVPWEERSLAREFPGEYDAYRRQVRWRILPYIY